MTNIRLAAFALALAPLSLLMPGAAHAQTAPAGAGEVPAGYILGADDVIEVSYYGPTVTTVKTRIKANGDITVPLIGTVTASGQTASSLSGQMAARLRAEGFYNNPIVNIEVTEFASNSVTVLGAVARPGIYPLERPYSLGEIIARAGGLGGDASQMIELRRGRAGAAQRYPLADLARNPDRDVVLRAGDVIYVAAAERFYIYGQISNGGMFTLTPGMTVRQALARAGGPTLAGSQDKIRLYRADREIDAALDVVLQPDDVLFVRERIF